jgi:hypothetical protein
VVGIQFWGISRWITAAAVASAVLFGAASVQAQMVRHAPKRGAGPGESLFWSGYAIDGSNATQVIGTWQEPPATCLPGEKSFSSPWVGIDGDNSNTVEQTGTDTDCSNGTPYYYAWYEMYPKNTVVLPMTVTPGDIFTGSVAYNGGIFTLSLTDDTTRVTATEQIATSKPHRSSVEWIVEGPQGGLLTDFGTVPFRSASAAISGNRGGLSSFGGAAQSITMVNNDGAVRAQPSAVSRNSSFTDTFVQN